MRHILISAALAVNTGAVLAADAPVCPSGDQWILPPSKPNDLGQQYLVVNMPQPVRIKVCNCSGAGKGESYVMLNAYRSQPGIARSASPKAAASEPPDTRLPNPNYSARLYAGSCLDAGGTEIYLRNTSDSAPAFGTYTPR